MRKLWIPTTLALALLFGSNVGSDPGWGPYRAPDVRPLRSQVFSLLVVGDYGIGNAAEAIVAEAMHEWFVDEGADAFVTAGDNVYPEAEPKYFEAAWSTPFGWVEEAGLPVLPSLGNHDVEDGSSAAVLDFFDMPGPWYSWSLDEVRIVVLDSNQVDVPEQTSWLKETLARPWTGWTIVVVHKPPYDCGRYDGTPEVRAAWAELFARHDVDLVISGHDHNYQRFAPLDGVTYVVTGGGGDSFYPLDDDCTAETPARLSGNDDLHHFVVVRGSDDTLETLAIAADGTLIDRFVQHAPPLGAR